MDLTHACLLIATGVGFLLGCLFAGFRAGGGAEVTFHAEGGTTTRIRADKPSELAEIMRLMREFAPVEERK